VSRFPDELAGRQVVDLLPLDRWVEIPTEILERLHRLPEGRHLHPPSDHPILPDVELVLEHELEELLVAEAVPPGLLEPNVQRLGRAGEPELPEGRRHLVLHDSSFLKFTLMNSW